MPAVLLSRAGGQNDDLLHGNRLVHLRPGEPVVAVLLYCVHAFSIVDLHAPEEWSMWPKSAAPSMIGECLDTRQLAASLHMCVRNNVHHTDTEVVGRETDAQNLSPFGASST